MDHFTVRPTFLALCTQRGIVLRSARVALVVGTLLALINHGDVLLGAEITAARLVRIALTYCVPYGVATYAGVQALRAQRTD